MHERFPEISLEGAVDPPPPLNAAIAQYVVFCITSASCYARAYPQIVALALPFLSPVPLERFTVVPTSRYVPLWADQALPLANLFCRYSATSLLCGRTIKA